MNRWQSMIGLVLLSISVVACAGSPAEAGNAASASSAPSAAPGGSVPTPRVSSSVASSAAAARKAPATSASASASAPVRERSNVIAAHGVSPYVVGARLDTLASRGLVANIIASENCDGTWQAADATGRYAGRLGLTFESGRLTDVVTTSGALVTPSGARVGMTLRDLQRIYGDRGKLITGVSGNQAFSVPVAGSKLGIVFFFEAADTHRVPKINAISAGGVERLEQSAYVGEGC